MRSVTFVLKKTSRHGLGNPIVARLSVQPGDLIQFFKVPQEQRDPVLGILIKDVQPRLLECMKIAESVEAEVQDVLSSVSRHGIDTQSDGRVVQLPQVMRLRERCESYLYNAKSALRDLAGILMPLFGHDFRERPTYAKLLKWSETNLGPSSPLSRLLAGDRQWIRQLVEMRNAVEHPKDAYVLHIHNFEISTPSNGEPLKIVPPTWHLNDDPQADIVADMGTFRWNLLHFSEDFFVACLQEFGMHGPTMIVEIPEEGRNDECPIRLRVVLDPRKVKTPAR